MSQACVALIAVTGVAVAMGSMAFAAQANNQAPVSPIYGVTLPQGYREWTVIAPAQEAAPLDELRVVVGNAVAVKAYRDGTLPFPDGAVLVKLAWKRVPSSEFAPASIPGAATTVQVMVKDSHRYASTGGWGFGRFINGTPADEAQHRTCHACHQSAVKDHDLVFTRYAP
ncbi:cytochrome P460 family protein [Dyella sp. C11]|uniref:cytochrome P460 family protein n=1 Tax=Dyella sp. C11 TaxID=2126991 RepID=UPI000D6552EE|nr:cytochrome P460 family protein [Dyella sp. C11]